MRAENRYPLFLIPLQLHGPDALYKETLRAVDRAAQCLKANDDIGAQHELDALGLTELSLDGEAMMRAVADDLGIKALDLPLRASMRTWNARDIARLLPIFKKHRDAARSLAKGFVVFNPWDAEDHPRWPAGAPASQGGEFAPAGESEAAVVPVATRGPPKPPKGSKPKTPSQPIDRGPGVRFIEPGDFPEGGNSPDGLQEPKLLGPDDLRPGIGHNSGDPTPLDPSSQLPPPQEPLEPPPEIPEEQLPDKARNLFTRAAVQWIARALILATAPQLAPYLIALQTATWVAEFCWPYIKAYFDPPKTLEELQADTLKPQPGYQKHHIVEQTPARKDEALLPLRDNGTLESLIEGRANLVRIPALKHEEISNWYSTPNPRYDGRSPRDFLRDKSWEERYKFGLQKLIDFGALKP